MILKLARSNIKGSVSDIMVYFFTLAFCIAIYFTFNSINENPQLMKQFSYASKGLDNIVSFITITSFFIVITMGILIVYSNWYFLKHRKYEFGIYLTLGMRKEHIIGILLIENLVIGVLAISLGILFGVVGSQFMTVMILKTYGMTAATFQFMISKYALISTLINFSSIFIVSVIVNTIAISRFKIVDLMYSKSDLEKVHTRNMKTAIILIVPGIIMLGMSYLMAITQGILSEPKEMMGEIFLGISGTVLIFIALSAIFDFYIKRRKKKYFKGVNIFVFGQIINKINSSSIVMAVTCLTLFLSSMVFMVGNSIKTTFEDKDINSMLYDVSTVIDYNERKVNFDIYDQLPKELKKKVHRKSFAQITIKHNGEAVSKYLKDIKDNKQKFDVAYFMSQKDFNKCLGMIGRKRVKIEKNEYIFAAENDKKYKFGKMLVENKVKLKIGKQVFTPVGVEYCRLDNMHNGRGAFILNDKVKQRFLNEMVVCNVNTDKDSSLRDEILGKIDDIVKEKSKDENKKAIFWHSTREEIVNDSLKKETLVTFLFIYISLVLMVTCGVVISIQQMLQIDKSAKKYKILGYLGADDKMINMALLKQISFYFLIPLIFAMMDFFVGVISIRELISRYGDFEIWRSLFRTGKFIILTYGLYFLLTYFSCKKMIYRKGRR